MLGAQSNRICDSESIHTPGTIQDFGCLVVVGRDEVVGYVSANAATYFDREPQQILDAPLSAIIDFALCPDLARLVRQPYLPRKTTLHRVRYRQHQPVLVYVSVHHKNGLCAIEFEPCLEVDKPQTELTYLAQQQLIQSRMYQALYELHDAPSLQELCDKSVAAIRSITSYDRVMVYRFDPQWRGEVCAEDKCASLVSYLGQSFPAGDIPPQARDVFAHNASRMIIDVDAEPLALIASGSAPYQKPFDMGRTQLRSPAPVHLEYLTNMEVRATFTLSLMVEDRLWGLIACHHTATKTLDAAHREAAEMVAKAFSALIPARLHSDSHARRIRLEARVQMLCERLPKNMDEPADLASQATAALMGGDDNLATLWAPAKGSAAVLMDGVWTRTPDAPDEEICAQVVAFLRHQVCIQEIYSSHHVAEDLPGISFDPQVCCGLLALRLAQEDNVFLLWFVPEVPQAIDWAGRPDKHAKRGDEGRIHIHPRRSFALWREELRGHSVPWDALQLQTALQLRRALIEWNLNRKVMQERAAKKQVEAEKQRFGLLAAASAFFGKPLGDGAALQGLGAFLAQQFCDWVVITNTNDDHEANDFFAHRDAKLNGKLAQWNAQSSLGELLQRSLSPHEDCGRPLTLDRSNAKDAELLTLMGWHSCIHLPLRVHQRDLGHIYLVRGPLMSAFDEDDGRLVLQLAERVAGVLDNDRSYRQSQSAIRAREYVLRIVSHDLRNPLGVVSLSGQALRRRLRHAPGLEGVAWQEPVNRIDRACATMERLISDVLSAANIESGHFQVRPEVMDGPEFFSDVKQALEPLCQAAKLHLEVHSAEMPKQLFGDKNRLMQAIGNLVSNAIRFTPSEGTITIRARRQQGAVLVEISDTGQGIPKDRIPKIFNQFWQGDLGKQSGAGLGLFIVRGIVAAHNGVIEVDSVVGQGSTFRFTCPDAPNS